MGNDATVEQVVVYMLPPLTAAAAKSPVESNVKPCHVVEIPLWVQEPNDR